MAFVLLIISILLVLVGHFFRILRWEQFIEIYERPSRGHLLRALAIGYAFNFVLPLHLGDVFRSIYSGKRMKNGIGFSFATVIMDRFLDVWVVTAIFGAFYLLGLNTDIVNVKRYVVFSVALAFALILAVVFRDMIKKCVMSVCSIFNDKIRLFLLEFFWSLINTFKDLLHIGTIRMLTVTVAMWASYLLSYSLLAKCFSVLGQSHSMTDVFSMLFGNNAINSTSIALASKSSKTGTLLLMFLIWTFLPTIVMFIITLLPKKLKDSLRKVATSSKNDYINLLPQINPKDRQQFLNKYFGLDDKEYIEKFLDLNRGVSIIQDFSKGSAATTMLCIKDGETFYRKYAFDDPGRKLAEQLDWLKSNNDRISLCRILREDIGEDYCCYDMEYDADTIDFFRYIHSRAVEDSVSILQDILRTLDKKLYSCTTGTNSIELYIEKKVNQNIRIIKESRVLKNLVNQESLCINGIDYHNIDFYCSMLEPKKLLDIFSKDPISCIHGDLTIENIICRMNLKKDQWYIIDPNTGNIHNSCYLDYAKLLQSLHGGYEFLMMSQNVSVDGNKIDFQLTRSAVYDELLKDLDGFIVEKYGEDGLKSIYYHEIIHWIRLLPYKITADKARAPMFYAGMIKVMDDVSKRFEK